MKAENAERLQTLCRRQRNRIWRDRVRRHIAPAIAYSATVLTLGAAGHQLWRPLDATVVVLAALAPALAALLLLALRTRPDEQAGAAEADRLIGANSLLVTAWELTRSRAETRGAARLVLQRCETALPGWSLPPETRPASPGIARLLALTAMLVALFFLWQPSQLRGGDAQIAIATPAENDPTVEAETLAGMLEDATRSDSSTAATGNTSPGFGTSTDAEATDEHILQRATASPSTADDTAAQAIPAQPIETGGAAPAATTRANAASPGIGQGASENGVTSVSGFEHHERVEIDAASAQGADAAGSLRQDVASPAFGKPVATGESLASLQADGVSSLLSPIQRNLVQRYLARLDELDDPEN